MSSSDSDSTAPHATILMVSATPHSPPSDWIQRWSHLLPAGAKVLDVACGSGRHVRWLQSLGCQVTGIDRDPQALAHLPAGSTAICADIEAGPWPLPGQQFDAVVVTNYLWRPLWPALQAALAPGGVLLYETFTAGNAAYGRPSRPDFLLQPGELLSAFSRLQPVAFEQGFLAAPDRMVQRLAAIKVTTDLPMTCALRAPGGRP